MKLPDWYLAVSEFFGRTPSYWVSLRLPLTLKRTIFPLLPLLGQLRTLIKEAQSKGQRFIYALSPGQDIVFSSSCDLTLLKRKLRQVCAAACDRDSNGRPSPTHTHTHARNRSSPTRCRTWVARHSPFCSTTSTTPCVRPTARPFRRSPTLRSP